MSLGKLVLQDMSSMRTLMLLVAQGSTVPCILWISSHLVSSSQDQPSQPLQPIKGLPTTYSKTLLSSPKNMVKSGDRELGTGFLEWCLSTRGLWGMNFPLQRMSFPPIVFTLLQLALTGAYLVQLLSPGLIHHSSNHNKFLKLFRLKLMYIEQ